MFQAKGIGGTKLFSMGCSSDFISNSEESREVRKGKGFGLTDPEARCYPDTCIFVTHVIVLKTILEMANI